MGERKKPAKNKAFDPSNKQYAPSRDVSIMGAIEQSPVGIYLTDNKGNCTYANQALLDLVGYAPEEVLGNQWVNALHPDDRDRIQNAWTQVIETGAVLDQECRLLHKDGRTTWVHALAMKQIDEAGNISGFIGINIIISGRKLAESQMQASEQKLRLLTENINQVIYLYDPRADKFQYVSPAYETIWGEPVTKVYADPRSFTRKVHPDDLPAFQEAVRREHEEGIFFDLEYRIRPTKKQIRWIHSRNTPIRDTDGNHILTVGTAEDITARRQTLQQLKEKEEQFRLIAETSKEIIWQVNTKGEVIFVSPSVTEITGYSLDELHEKKFRNIVSPSAVTQALQVFKNALSGEDIPLVEIEIISQDGSLIPMESSVTPILHSGMIIGLQGIARDITRRKAAQRERETLFKSMQEAQQLANLGTWEWDLVNDYELWSDELFRIFGRQPQAQAPHPDEYGAQYLPQDRDKVHEALERSLSKGTAEAQFRLFRLDDHEERIVRMRCRVENGADGLPVRQIGTIIDITEAQQREEELTRLLSDLNVAQSVSHVGSWRWDIKTGALQWSDEMYRIFGIERDNSSVKLQDVIARAIHPDDIPAVEASNRSVIEKGVPVPLQYRILQPDGELRIVWAEAGHLITDENGKPAFLTGVIMDITDRMSMEMQLTESQQQYSSLVEDTPILISRWLPDGTLTFVNRAFCEFFGKSAEKLIGSSIFQSIPGDELESVKLAIAQLSPSNPVQVSENNIIRHDGQMRWTRWTDRAFFDPEGKVIHYQSNGIDIHERRLAEVERNRLLHALQEAQRIAQVGSWEWDIARDVYEWSDELFRIYGCDPQKGVPHGEDHVALIHPADLAGMQAAKKESLETGLYACDYRLFRFDDGQERIVNVVGVVEFDPAGKPIRQRGTIRDVSEIRQAEAALRKSEEDNRRLIEHAGLGIGFYDLQGNILRMNRVACEFMQTTEDQLIGRNALDAYGQDMGEKMLERIALATRQGSSDTYEDLVTLPGGSKWFRSTYASIIDETDQTVGVQIISEDISTIKAAELELVKNQTILENFSDAVIRTDLDGRITFWNKGAQTIFGYTAGETLGKPVSMLWWPQDFPSFENIFKQAQNGSDLQYLEVRVRTREHQQVETLLSILPLENAAGEVIELVNFYKDITPLKKAQIALQASERTLSTLMGSLPGMAYRCDNDAAWTMRFVSQGCQDLTGYTPEELLLNAQIAFADLIHPADRALVSQQVRENLQARRPFEMTYRIRCKDGREKWVWEKGNEVEDIFTGRMHLEGFISDITARISGQEALRAHARFLDTIMEFSPIAMFITDPGGTITRTNRTLRKTLHLVEGQIIGKYNVRADQNLVEQGVMPQVEEVFEKKESTRFTIFWKAENTGHVDFSGGEDLWLDASLFPVLDDDGSIKNVICQWVDVTEQITANLKLRESEQHYQSVVEDSPVMIARFLPDGMITFANRMYSHFFTGQENGIVGRRIFDFVLDDHLQQTRDYLASFTPRKAVNLFDDQVRRFDGSTRWIRWTDRAMFDDLGKLVGFQTFGRDITEQKETEIALRESELQYQSVVEDSPLLIIRYLPDGTISFVNSHYCQFYTGKINGLPWKTIYDKDTPEKKARVKEELDALTPEQPVRNLEALSQRFDGQQRWLRWKDVALFDDDGTLMGYQAFAEDVHEQHLAEEKLRESERTLEALMDNLPGIAYRADAHGRHIFQFLSQGCKELTGYEPEEFLENPDFMYEMIMVEEYKEPLIEQIQYAIEHNTAFEISYRIIAKDGQEKWVWERGSVVLDDAGKPHHIEGFITDITDRVLAEKRLTQSEARFRAFMDNFPANAYIKDEKLRHVFVNRATSAFGGIPQEEYIGKTTADIYPPELAAELDEIDRSVLHDGGIREYEGYYVSPTGERRFQRDIKFPIAGIDGEKMVGGIALDMTSQKTAEERLVDRAKFDKMLAEISTDFLRTDAHQLDDAIVSALTTVGKFLDFDRIAVNLLTKDHKTTTVTYVWSEKVLKNVLEKYDRDNYPWLFSTSIDGINIVWSLNDGLPKDLTKAEKKLFAGIGIQSFASLPIQISGKVGGSIVFSDLENPAKFTPDLIESLQLFSQIISNAITLRDAAFALMESERRYRSVVEDSPIFIARYTSHGILTYSNPAYCDFFGLINEELIGKKIFDLIPEDTRAAARERLAAISIENPLYSVESKALRHDGQERWVRWTVRGLVNKDGAIDTIQSFGIDITDQRLAAERIAASERQFRSLFTQMASGFSLFEVVYDEGGKAVDIAFVEVNPAFEEITGLQKGAVIGKPITAVLPQFDRGWLQDYIDIAQHDLTLHRKDFNSRLGIFTDIHAFSPRTGQCAVLLTDITEQENLNHQVETERDKAQNYLDTVQSIVIGLDKEGNLTLANPKACQILGYSEAELIGKNWFDLCLPPENVEEIKGVLHKVIQGEMEYVQYYENLIRTRSGNNLAIAWHNAILTDREGNFIGVLSAGEDITARRAAEERIQTLFDISVRLIAESYGQDILQSIADEVLRKIKPAQAITIWLYDVEKNLLSIQANAGYEANDILGLTVDISEGVVGKSASSRQPILVQHAQKNEDFQTKGGFIAAANNIQCMLCAPLIMHDKLLGVISVDNFDSPEAFTMEDLNLVESIANQLAGVVENAMLFEELQKNRAELRALSQRLLEVHEEERRAVALDLHDHFGQILTTFKLSLRPEAFLKYSAEEQRARLAEVTSIVDELIEAAEDLSLRLRPSILDDLGLVLAIEWHVNRFTRQSGIPVTLNISVERSKRFPENVEITLYRVMEEGLSNALQHGQPTMIQVDLFETDEKVMLHVRDNGIGFDLQQIENDDHTHTGLTGMQERVCLIEGIIDIRSEPGKGTTIQVMVPKTGITSEFPEDAQ